MKKNPKILIIYYSLTGNVKFIAEKLADILSCDLKNINDISSKKYHKLELILDYFIPSSCHLQISEHDLNQYDIIIYGYPIWMFNKVHPLFSKLKILINQNHINFAVFASYSFFSWNFPGQSGTDTNYLNALKLKSPLFFNEMESINTIAKWSKEIIKKYERKLK